MFFNKKLREYHERLDQGLEADFGRVSDDIQNLNARVDKWARKHSELENELATNGVIRDIRDLQKRMDATQEMLESINTNGMSERVSALYRELSEQRKEKKSNNVWASLYSLYNGESVEKEYEPTLAGKVDAIIEHLGLDVSVSPEEVKEAKVVAKKQKTTKKKGRR